MGDSHEEYEREFYSIMNELDNGIAALQRNRKGFDRGQVEMLRSRLKRARDCIKSYRVEIRSFKKEEQGPFLSKATEMETKASAAENNLNWTEKQGENGGAGIGGAEATVQAEFNKVMNQGLTIQKEDIGRLQNVLQDTETINMQGTQIVQTMAEQEEQLKRIDGGLNQVDSNLKLAQRQMRVFARKMATDKIIMGLILLIVIAIIFVIVYSIVKPNSNPTVRNQVVGST